MKTVIEMASEAGIIHPEMVDKTLKRFAELARADAIASEREACAKVVEEQWGRWALPVTKEDYNEMWSECAAAIRARSNT